jgi:hypothetical protein
VLFAYFRQVQCAMSQQTINHLREFDMQSRCIQIIFMIKLDAGTFDVAIHIFLLLLISCLVVQQGNNSIDANIIDGVNDRYCAYKMQFDGSCIQ